MLTYPPLFADRSAAGHKLGQALRALQLADPIIYALPRGGVAVAVEIAKALGAPVDVILVRKIGAPGAPELALAAVVDGGEVVVNENVRRLSGATPGFLEAARQRELDEIARRRSVYLGGRARSSAKGRTAIVVDDGLATGATAKAALRALRREGAAKVVLAIPVAPAQALAEMRREADDVVCLEPSEDFMGVGGFYGDFHQLSDDETVRLLRAAQAPASKAGVATRSTVVIPPVGLTADLQVPAQARGVVLFAHGSGSSRLSPRNRAVADFLGARGFATLLLDLLTDAEAQDRRNVFDIALLAERLGQAAAWIALHEALGRLPLGLFGASTGAAAALVAAATLGRGAAAVVSRGGRPDLAGQSLARVTAPTLLIVGAEDDGVIDLNRAALATLRCEKALKLVPRAGHLFEEPGTLDDVMRLAIDWFGRHLVADSSASAASGATQAVARPPALTPAARLRAAVEPLPATDDPGFGMAFDRFADRRVVLLGEASHGTSEFYRARAAITRRLIEQHGFEMVAVEADWPDAAAVDRYVRLKPHRSTEMTPFSRFPAWMWRNRDVEAFARWLRGHNAGLPSERRTAFYGLDLYNMRASMAAVLDYLDKVDPKAAAQARERYRCLTPWSAQPAAYGLASLQRGYALCEGAVVNILRDMLGKALDYAAGDGERFFDAEQNARLVADAERYYRALYYGSHESWNLRDRHMWDTLERALAAKGPHAKAVVWAHNSHIGDARFTDMGAERGELNIGQLARERYGAQAALIGFGTHTGTVMAADDWDEPGRVMQVRPSRADSYEALCHQTDIGRFLLDLRKGRNEQVRGDLREPRLERYIGVVYRPATEMVSHYARSCLSEQYDAFVWFDTTVAVEPLTTEPAGSAEDETYPFGL